MSPGLFGPLKGIDAIISRLKDENADLIAQLSTLRDAAGEIFGQRDDWDRDPVEFLRSLDASLKEAMFNSIRYEAQLDAALKAKAEARNLAIDECIGEVRLWLDGQYSRNLDMIVSDLKQSDAVAKPASD